ncbi:MAG: hypothetical protein ACKOGA_00785, partial [Planctomycetaceae bacterium]
MATRCVAWELEGQPRIPPTWHIVARDLPGSGRIGLSEVPPSFADPVRLEPFLQTRPITPRARP